LSDTVKNRRSSPSKFQVGNELNDVRHRPSLALLQGSNSSSVMCSLVVPLLTLDTCRRILALSDAFLDYRSPLPCGKGSSSYGISPS